MKSNEMLTYCREFYEGSKSWSDLMAYGYTPNRLYSCKAWYCIAYDCVILKSYDTVVAIYSFYDEALYSLGRYSITTYQHIRKFRSLIKHDWGYPVQSEVNLEFENWFK